MTERNIFSPKDRIWPISDAFRDSYGVKIIAEHTKYAVFTPETRQTRDQKDEVDQQGSQQDLPPVH